MSTTKILYAKDEACIVEAAACLAQGGTVALPTETVYGLAAHAFLPHAVSKIFVAKNRPLSNPLIWHVHDAQAALNLFNHESFSEQSKRRFKLLAHHFWPGPLTLVAAKSALVSHDFSTVAVRIPRSDLTLGILQLLKAPLVMPSANISSRPSPTCAEHVLKTLNGRIDAVVEGGICDVGIESTVIRFDQDQVNILRPGLISAIELQEILHEPVVNNQHKTGMQLESPGLAYRHYAPKVERIVLVKPEAVVPRWQSSDTLIARAQDILFFIHRLGSRPSNALTISLPDEPQNFAQGLYKALYCAEENPHETLVLVAPSELEEGWAAIHDRLGRSSGII